MTCRELYKIELSKVIENYRKEVTEKLDKYSAVKQYADLELPQQIIHYNSLIETLDELRTEEPEQLVVDLGESIEPYFYGDMLSHRNKLNDLRDREQNEIYTIQRKRDMAIESKELEIERWLTSKRESLRDIIKRHEVIVNRKDELNNIFHIYKIDANEVTVDLSSLQLSEVSELIDISTVALDHAINNTSLASKVTSLFYLPSILKLDSDENDRIFKVSYFVALLIICLIKPYFLSVVSFTYLVTMFANMYKVYEREELLKVCYALTCDIDFDSYIIQDAEYEKLIGELEELKLVDVSEEENKVTRKYSNLVVELMVDNPSKALEEERACYANNLDYVTSELDKVFFSVRNYWEHLCKIYESEITNMNSYFDTLNSKIKLLGSEISNRKVLSLSMKLGVCKVNDKIIAEASYNVPLQNILFTYTNDAIREEQIRFIKLLLCNVLCNVKEKHITVHIYDHQDLGRDFAEFYNNVTSDYIFSSHSNFKKTLDKRIEESKKNIIKFGRDDIQKFNTDAEDVGRVTADYNLLIILSTEEDINKNKSFKSFFDYSAGLGTIIWYLAKDESLYKDRERKVAEEFYSGKLRSTEYCEIIGKDLAIGDFEYPIERYEYSHSLGGATISKLCEVIEENKADILPYETGFRLKYIPDDKIWTYSTHKGINLHYGLLDGDPLKGYPVILGDNAPHGLMAGETGAGKSATLNELISNLLHMYPPEELELVMVDFKNAEFFMYTGEYLIPHAKIIAGTTDGEYALSIFDYLEAEGLRRAALYREYQLQDNERYNTYVLNHGMKEKYIPRMLAIFDEFQVMFQKVDPKIVDVIKGKIENLAKVLRFCAMHMYFTSQSMTGTVTDDVLDQFKLRAALHCSVDTSNQLIRNDAAAKEIKTKGFIITSTNISDRKNNMMWRIPFIDDEYIKVYLKKLIKKCEDEGRLHRHAVFYDEKEKHPGSVMMKFYENNPNFREDNSLFIIGERTSYSTNLIPNNFRVIRDDCENVLCAAFERISILNLANTFIENIKLKSDCSLMIHTCDRDSLALLDLENRVDDRYKYLLNPSMTAHEVLSTLELLVNFLEDNPEAPRKKLYFLGLYWDKLSGLARDEDYVQKVGERFTKIMQKAPLLNIHIILIIKDTREFRKYRNLFNHRIVSFVEEADSLNILEISKGNKISKDFGLYQYGSIMRKFKIYQFELAGEVEEREIKLFEGVVK
jgi:hypothetical protein